MVKRKKIGLLLLFVLISITIVMIDYFFTSAVDINKSFIFTLSIFSLIIMSYCLLLAFLSLYKIFSKLKNELKIMKETEKAVKDIYM